MQEILDRLRKIDAMIQDGAKLGSVKDALDALQLDIEIYCRRTGVPCA